MNQLLTDRHAVIYGGGGALGAGIVRAFVREGAHVHLAGRSRERLERLAAEPGEAAHVAVLEAGDEAAVEARLASMPDAKLSLAAVREDIRITMPANSMCFEGRAQMADLFETARQMGEWRLLATAANRMPTAASYVRAAGDTLFRAFKFDVLRIEGDVIVETTTFIPDMFPAFGPPPTLANRSGS